MTNLGIRQVPDYGRPIALDSERITTLIPIATTSTSDGNGETIGATLTWTINDLLRAERKPPYRLIFTTHGVIGQDYNALKRDSIAYNNAILTVARVNEISSPECVVLRAITVIHGEADFLAGTPQAKYEEDLLNWQRSFSTDFKRVTGQNTDVIMFMDQMNSYTAPLFRDRARTTAIIPLAQLQAAIDHPKTISLVGPKYFLDYAEDGVHLTARSEQLLGEYYGKAYKRTVIDGRPWKPLYPTEISISGRVITVTFNVPAPPLVLDHTLVLDPGNEGFDYSDGSESPPSITWVNLKPPDQVQILLSHAPVAKPGKRFLSYAWKGKIGSPAGPSIGPRGNLRDSDNLVGRYSHRRLYNWCATFRIAL